MPTPEEISEKLVPKHLLPESTDDLKKAVEATVAKPTDEEALQKRASHPKAQEKYPFELGYRDARGKLWAGSFVNKILSPNERSLVGIMRARLSGGIPYEALDPLTRELNLIRAHLAYSLVEKPEWAKNLEVIVDYTVLQAIFEEVDSHEAYFLGFRDDPGARGSSAA